MRISDWSSDVCSSDLQNTVLMPLYIGLCGSSSVSHLAWCLRWMATHSRVIIDVVSHVQKRKKWAIAGWKRSEEHTSELQSLMRISYAVFCLKKKKTTRD